MCYEFIKALFFWEIEMKQRLSKDGIEMYLSRLSFLNEEALHNLTPWERKFITDVYDQILINPKLSKKQMDRIDSIFERVQGEWPN